MGKLKVIGLVILIFGFFSESNLKASNSDQDPYGFWGGIIEPPDRDPYENMDVSPFIRKTTNEAGLEEIEVIFRVNYYVKRNPGEGTKQKIVFYNPQTEQFIEDYRKELSNGNPVDPSCMSPTCEIGYWGFALLPTNSTPVSEDTKQKFVTQILNPLYLEKYWSGSYDIRHNIYNYPQEFLDNRSNKNQRPRTIGFTAWSKERCENPIHSFITLFDGEGVKTKDIILLHSTEEWRPYRSHCYVYGVGYFLEKIFSPITTLAGNEVPYPIPVAVKNEARNIVVYALEDGTFLLIPGGANHWSQSALTSYYLRVRSDFTTPFDMESISLYFRDPGETLDCLSKLSKQTEKILDGDRQSPIKNLNAMELIENRMRSFVTEGEC